MPIGQPEIRKKHFSLQNGLIQWGDVTEGCILAWKGVRKVANFLFQFLSNFYLTLFLYNSVILWILKTKFTFEKIISK
jgi:hypothetical protein